MPIYVGVNGTPKEVSSLYVGVNGVPKECTEVYAGDNGSAKLVLSSKLKESIFTTSGTFTVPNGVNEIEVFCVGGGSFCAMNGGGGGYTTTSKLSVSQADSIPVEIGAGAIGGSTHAGSNTSVSSVIANGARNSATIAYGPGPGTTYGGGNGGSGGGSVRSGLFYKDEGSNGGSDGSDGDASKWMWNSSTVYTPGGVGQGTTTRAFGESEGTLYAGGGGGCSSGTPLASNYIVGKGGAGGGGNGGAYSYLALYVNPTDGGINTGGGAGGCCTTGEVDMRRPTAGSGIAIIRY